MSWMDEQLERYRDHREALGYAVRTSIRECTEAKQFLIWAEAQGCQHPQEVTSELVRDYQKYLVFQTHRGRPLNARTVRHKLSCLKRIYHWLSRQDLVEGNPFEGLEFGKASKQYVWQALTEAEVARVMATPNVKTANGIRVRAILETFYSTGLRTMELAGLSLYDVDQARGWIRVDQGKFKQDRVVPIGDSALFWISRYLVEVRPFWLRGPDTGHLFLSGKGRYYKYGCNLSMQVRRYFDKAGIGKPGACHLLRHSAATHMLKHGADIRHIQAMLGHACLRTTECYTQLACEDLKQAQKAYHPWG